MRRNPSPLLGLLAAGILSACQPIALQDGSSDEMNTLSVAAAGKPGGGMPPPPPLDYSGYALAWSDEFDAAQLDTAVWTPEIGNGANGWGNNELEYYTDRPENLRLENGQLVIEARMEAYAGFGYTSARLKTQGKKTFQYGILEARIKTPVGNGYWPAFWMLGNNIPTAGWPQCGEIDIIENKGTNTTYGYAHWFNDAAGAKNSSGSTASLDIALYHTYSVKWTAASIQWYVDGVQLHSLSTTAAGMDEFRQDFFLLLNLAVGGNFTGSPRRSTVFPGRLNVDWVRVYQ